MGILHVFKWIGQVATAFFTDTPPLVPHGKIEIRLCKIRDFEFVLDRDAVDFRRMPSSIFTIHGVLQ